MRNRFRICGDLTYIELKRRDGIPLDTVIETSDLLLVQSFKGTWHAHWSPTTKSFYVRGRIPKPEGGYERTTLHRWIVSPAPGLLIDHMNHDTLDNRRSNLHPVTYVENGQNRKGAASNNRSCGVRGVTWVKNERKFRVTVVKNKKTLHIGSFDDIHEAEQAAINARRELYPYLHVVEKVQKIHV